MDKQHAHSEGKLTDSKKSHTTKQPKAGMLNKLKKKFSTFENYFSSSSSSGHKPKRGSAPAVHQRSSSDVTSGDSGFYSDKRSMTLQPGASLSNGSGTMTSDSTLVSSSSAEDLSKWQMTCDPLMTNSLNYEHIELSALQPPETKNFRGHTFKPATLDRVTWCDSCGDHIWGSFGFTTCYRCKDCQMTCHFHCCQWIRLGCEPPEKVLPQLPAYLATRNAATLPKQDPSTLPHEDMDSDSDDDPYTTLKGDQFDRLKGSTYSTNNNNADTLKSDVSTLRSPLTETHPEEREALTPPALPTSDPPFLFDTDSAGNTPYGTARSQVPIYYDESVASSDYTVDFRFSLFLGGLAYNSGLSGGTLSDASMTSVSSLSSTACSSLRLPYEFSTLDRTTIQRFGLNVKEEGAQPVSAIPTGGTLRWNAGELTKRVQVFNRNDYGLFAQMPDGSPHSCQGTVRVHINLIRPIKMLLTARPASIYDVMGGEAEVDENPMAELASFRMPRGTSKLLHIGILTTAQEVISSLLKKFRIKDNPHKFMLYEHTIEGDREVSVRKLSSAECPLSLFFSWTGSGEDEFRRTLEVKRLVLQENETGDIDWTAFSVPELNNFLTILTREEDEHRRVLEMTFKKRREELERLLGEARNESRA